MKSDKNITHDDDLIEDVAAERKWHDAVVLGTPTPEMGRLLDTHVTLMFGATAYRSEWQPVTSTWRQALEGVAGNDSFFNQKPARGLLRHPVSPHKDGPCVIFGTGEGDRRSNKTMRQQCAIALDVDSGAKVQDVVNTLVEKGLFAVVYTSHSHGKTCLNLGYGAVQSALGIHRDPTLDEVREYLTKHTDYPADFITAVELVNAHKLTDEDGIVIELRTPPLEKFRVVLPLAEVVDSPSAKVWRQKVAGVGAMLGVEIDAACTDTARWFYLPRHAKGRPHKTYLIQGAPLHFEGIKVSNATRKRKKVAGTGSGTQERFISPSGLNLARWWRENRDRLMLADLLRDHGHGLGEASGGGEVIRCPFADEHTDPEKTGSTVAWNAADSDCGFAVIFCQHNSCQNAERKTQHFLQKMMEDKMFDEEALFDENYLLPPEEVEAHAENAREDSVDDGPAHLTDWDSDRITAHTQRVLDAANAADPKIFNGPEGLSTIRNGAIVKLSREDFGRWVNDNASFVRPQGEGRLRKVLLPREVRDYLFACDPAQYPPLRGIVTAPFYDGAGALVSAPGYHPSANVYLPSARPLSAPVSVVPSEAEVKEAKRLIVEEVLADFPLDGLTRPEIMKSLTGTAIPAVTHAVVLMLQPFMRELIDGPTPGYVFTKPVAGTGATLLVETITSVYGGRPAPTLRIPSRKEEVEKTLAAVLRGGSTHAFFDNVSIALDSGDLASAMTSTYYEARILGKTEVIQVPVRCTWIFTANNFQASGELQRRMVFIPLDAHSAAPAQRSGWRNADLAGWVRQHHGELTWACLTLIQHWIAEGRPAGTATLGSYEAWARAMGGVVGAAGFGGFLEGQAEVRAAATADMDAALAELLELFAAFEDGTAFRAGSNAPFQGAPTISVKALLNGEVRADPDTGKERGGAGVDALQVDGWGYVRSDGYTNSTQIGHRLRTLARKPHKVESGVIRFDTEKDRTKNTVYVMRKAVE